MRSGAGKIETGSEGLSNVYKVTQLVKWQRQDLNPGMAGPIASALLSYADCLSSRQ